jgi:hypothetical protein
LFDSETEQLLSNSSANSSQFNSPSRQQQQQPTCSHRNGEKLL